MAGQGSYKAYRTTIAQMEPPCVPYLGIYLTDLTFIEEGNKNYLQDRKEFLNFNKRRWVSEIIKLIQKFQNSDYILKPEPCLRTFLSDEELKTQLISENKMYELSLKLEPREVKKKNK